MGAADGEAAVRVGISIVPATETLDRIRELVRAADEAGLDAVGIQDHPYQRRFLDTWSLIPMLLAETKPIALFTDAAASRGDGEGGRVAGCAERRALRARPRRRRFPRRGRGHGWPAANAGRVRRSAR